MDSLEINRILRSHKGTRGIFEGVYPCDQLPSNQVPRPSAFVINLDPSTSPGSHWVAVYFDINGNSEYFDSYGKDTQNPAIKIFLRRNTLGTYLHNERRLQGDLSAVCGQYVIYYLVHKARGFSVAQITRHFDSDTHFNDHYVNDFVKRRYNVDKLVHDPSVVFKQISRALIQT